jgi:serine/threonine-protein kinase
VAKAKKPRISPGEIVADRYRIEGTVGRGGFGAVYKATQLHTQQQVALKILLKNFSNAKVDFKRFQREAALVQKLRHPNVVQLLDFGETEKRQPFIAFELLHGRALGKVLKDGAVPLYRAGEIARDVLQALEAAHNMGIVHRDIKPQNIFLLENGIAKVLDFGIAKAVTGEDAGGTQLTEAGQMIGTPHYMAPEQVRGNEIIPGTDLYALGLLMAELITGKRVVAGNALIDIYMMHISDDPFDFDPMVKSCALFPVIERATKKVIEERYATASEMLADLRAVLPGMSPGAAEQAKTTMMGQVSEDMLGGTFELPKDEVAELVATTDVKTGDEPLPQSSTVLMHMPNLAEQVKKIEAASGLKPNLDATVDMSRQPKPDWSSRPPASSGWPAPPHSGPAPSVAAVPHSVVQGPSTHPQSVAAPGSQAHPSNYPSYNPSLHNSGVHSSGVHNSGVHQGSGMHQAPQFGSGAHDHSGFHQLGDGREEMYSEYDDGEGGGLAWLLIVVAVIALVAAGVLIWAPWEEASSLSHDSPKRLVIVSGSVSPRA